jgi:hypothetical protein
MTWDHFLASGRKSDSLENWIVASLYEDDIISLPPFKDLLIFFASHTLYSSYWTLICTDVLQYTPQGLYPRGK